MGGRNGAAGAGTEGDTIVLGLAALFLAAASASATPSLTSSAPWWEKVTYTFDGNGGQQSCRYESSLAGGRACDADEETSPMKAGGGASGTYTKITIERRFSPGGQPEAVGLEAGDTLLGGQVLALAIDGKGAVKSCRTIVASGDIRPAYGCEEAKAERFEASARERGRDTSEGYMTIIVYGHEEYLA